MRRMLLLFAAFASLSFGQSLVGFWSGTLEVEGKTLRAWVEFSKDADGTLKGVAESPDETGDKWEITSIRQEGKKVMFSIAAVNGFWQGEFSADGSQIVGEWHQEGMAHPLTMKRGKREKKE